MAYSQQIKDFEKRMKALPVQLLAELDPVLATNANELADAQRHLAEESRQTGELIESITVTAPGGTSPAYSMGGAKEAGEHTYIVSAGNHVVRYAAHVELGTVHAEAHPFFWPAVRALKRRQLARLSRATTKFFKRWSGE